MFSSSATETSFIHWVFHVFITWNPNLECIMIYNFPESAIFYAAEFCKTKNCTLITTMSRKIIRYHFFKPIKLYAYHYCYHYCHSMVILCMDVFVNLFVWISDCPLWWNFDRHISGIVWFFFSFSFFRFLGIVWSCFNMFATIFSMTFLSQLFFRQQDFVTKECTLIILISRKLMESEITS